MRKLFIIWGLCLLGTLSSLQAQTLPALLLPEAELGNTNVAYPLMVTDFTAIVGLQLTLSWSPEALVLDSVGAYQLPGLAPFSFNVDSLAGTLRFIWFDASLEGVTLADGAAPFTMYFSAGDTPADTNHVVFNFVPTVPQVVQLDNGNFNEFAPMLDDGFITLRPGLAIESLTVDQVTCFGANNGAAAIQLTGGLAPYRYFWNNTEGTSMIEDLTPGNYELLVFDSDLDTLMANFTIVEPTELLTETTVTNASCLGAADGSIDLSVSGGTPGYIFQWSNEEETEDLDNLPFGEYSLLVTDDNGCTASLENIAIEAPNLLVETMVIQPSCANNNDGTISIVTIGLENIAYQWDYNNATTASIEGLPAATYSVTITHPSGCEETATETLTIPDATDPELSIIYGCGDDNVRIRSNPPGDVEDYMYSWSTGSTASQLFNLNAGNYALTFTDPNGCVTEEEVLVEYRPPLVVDAVITDISCFGADDGAISLQLTGGEQPYVYDWTNGATTASLGNLSMGVYEVNISAGADCNVFRAFMVNEPAPLGFTTDVMMQNDGLFSVVVAVSGGTPPFVYSWSNGASGAVLTDLPAGTYELQITDAAGCQYTESVLVGATNATGPAAVNALKIFPNPARGEVNVTIPATGSVSLVFQVFNLAGQQVNVPAYKKTQGAWRLDVSQLIAGTYLVRASGRGGYYFGKMVVF